MKTTNLLFAVLTASMAFTASANKNGNNNKSSGVAGSVKEDVALEVNANISNMNVDLPKALYHLYEDNDLIQIGFTDRLGKFNITLLRNKNYVIEVIAPDYLPKRIYFNTSMKREQDESYVFSVSIELIKLEYIKGANVSDLDFPYAIVKYDSKEKKFDYDYLYSAKMKLNESVALYESMLIQDVEKHYGINNKKTNLRTTSKASEIRREIAGVE